MQSTVGGEGSRGSRRGGGVGESKERRRTGEEEEVNNMSIFFLPIKHTFMYGTEYVNSVNDKRPSN